MIDRREILDMAGTLGLLPHVVEKDYVLGWVLAGIYRQTALAERWIFKGGTCLKKCYFETYRFSEDLDFTLTDPSQPACPRGPTGPSPRAGRRQPRRGRVAPRAGPSRGLPGQAATEPVGHFCAAAPVHFYAAVDIHRRSFENPRRAQ